MHRACTTHRDTKWRIRVTLVSKTFWFWCAPLLLDGLTSDIDFAVVALSRRSSPWAELRSLLRTAGWRICQLRWKWTNLIVNPVTWFGVSMSRKCSKVPQWPVFEYLRNMNPSYCVTEVRIVKVPTYFSCWSSIYQCLTENRLRHITQAIFH